MSISVLNTDAGLSGKTLVTAEGNHTVTGLLTFDRGTSAPMAVVAGAAVVANLDADKLDGVEATAFPRLAAANAFTSTNTFTGNIGAAALVKIFLDGVAMTGDTYIVESAANVLSLFSGGVEAKLTSGVLTLGAVGVHTITGGSNATQTLSVVNTTSGTAGKVEHLQTAGTAVGRLSTFSQGFTTSGLSQLSSTLLEAQASGGLTLAASNAAGVVRFYSGGTTKRAEFSADGLLSLDSTGAAGGVYVRTTYATRAGVVITTTADAANGAFLQVKNAAGTEQGSITATNSTTTAFNTTSDQRLKRDCGVVSDDVSVLRATKIHEFEWKPNGIRARGVFAQEAIAVAPHVVTKGDDDEAVTKPWQVDYSKYVPDLIVGWQHLDARIAALEARK